MRCLGLSYEDLTVVICGVSNSGSKINIVVQKENMNVDVLLE